MKIELKEIIINNNKAIFPLEYPENIFMINDGWFDLVNNALEELSPFPITLIGIKERYGRLQISYTLVSTIDLSTVNKIDTIIELVAKKSKTICTSCGEDAKRNELSDNFDVLCKKHKNT